MHVPPSLTCLCVDFSRTHQLWDTKTSISFSALALSPPEPLAAPTSGVTSHSLAPHARSPQASLPPRWALADPACPVLLYLMPEPYRAAWFQLL